MPSQTPDEFICGEPLTKISGHGAKSLWEQRRTGKGPLAPILTKLGSRVGVWRSDWEKFAASQRKLPDKAIPHESRV